MPHSWEDRVLRFEKKGTCTFDGNSLTFDVTDLSHAAPHPFREWK